MRSAVPSIVSSVVMTIRRPRTSSTGPPPFRRPVRIFGPERSWSTAMGRPAVAEISRTRWRTSRCWPCSPWEKFSRTTSMPAWTSRSRTARSREAGPMVATILVLRMGARV